jgi:broad specificity phosphatase PhoE
MNTYIKKKEIYLVRHGQTDWNALKIPQGGEHDIPLNAKGHEQSIKTAEYFATYRIQDKPFDLIISSGMIRANETAEHISKAIGYNGKIEIEQDLKEQNWGTRGGTSFDDLKTIANDNTHPDDPKHYIALYVKMMNIVKTTPDPINKREMWKTVHRFENKHFQSEPDKIFRHRVKKAMKKIYTRPEKKIIVVSHGETIQQTLEILTNITDNIRGDYSNNQTNCHISCMEIYEKQYMKNNHFKTKTKFKIILMPNTLHLN